MYNSSKKSTKTTTTSTGTGPNLPRKPNKYPNSIKDQQLKGTEKSSHIQFLEALTDWRKMKEKFPNPRDKVREENVILEEDDEYIDEEEET